MTPEIFRKALAATARVACCSVVLGCAHRAPEAARPAESRAPAPGSSVGQAPRPAGDDCQAHTRAVFTEKTLPVSARTKECCRHIAAGVDLRQLGDWQERDSCCKLLDWQGPIACTPWGPPCPPALETA